MIMITVKELAQSLREGKYTSLGCYPKFYFCSDGRILSHEAVMANFLQIGRAMTTRKQYPFQDQWRVIAVDINWEDRYLYCDVTGNRIESAYAE